MLEFIPLAETATGMGIPETIDTGPSMLRVIADGALSIGFVAAVYRLGRRALMGKYLPEDMSDVDLPRSTSTRDPRAILVMAACYLAGVGLTASAVYLVTGLAYALAWSGAWALVAAVVALLAARDASPLDDVRVLVEARRQA